jgi:dihydroorotase
MVHIGDAEKQVPPALTQEILPLLEPGDILSHVYTAKPGSVLRPDGTVLPELREAAERGVVLDIAHGRLNFSYEVARKCIKQGILPTTISTDLSALTLKHVVYGLTVTISKLLALGLDLKQVIEMSTINPARAIKEEARMGSLKAGTDADVSILELLSGTWKLQDAEQETIEVTRLISPVMAIRSGQPIPASPAAQPKSSR